MTRRRTRLDVLLVERGLFESRNQAATALMAGEVTLPGGPFDPKPGTLVNESVEVAVAPRARYVSRGGLKLEHALERFALPVAGRSCLDLGASTGGFCDCLLQAGARRVIAVDVGYGELHWRLREDPRVHVIERRNARELESGELAYEPDLVVADLSFIGLAKVLPAIKRCAATRFDLLALVKPQFEVGRERVGKGGVVRDANDRLDALVAVGTAAHELGLSVHGFCESGLPGPAGNRESFIWCGEPARAGVDDLVAAAMQAEPDAEPGARAGG